MSFQRKEKKLLKQRTRSANNKMFERNIQHKRTRSLCEKEIVHLIGGRRNLPKFKNNQLQADNKICKQLHLKDCPKIKIIENINSIVAENTLISDKRK